MPLELRSRRGDFELYNYVPTSGHPDGSISSGRLVAGILLDCMDYDGAPHRPDADFSSASPGLAGLPDPLRDRMVYSAGASLLVGDRSRLDRDEGQPHGSAGKDPEARRPAHPNDVSSSGMG